MTTKMTNKFKGYSLFNDVEDRTLQTWNRCVTVLNINKSNEALTKQYLAHFDEKSKRAIMAMLQYIMVIGAEEVRKQVMRGDIDTLADKAKKAVN